MRPIDLTGQKIGSLTVLSPARKHGRTAWLCKCDCGREVIRETCEIRNKGRTYCGKCERGNKSAERIPGVRLNNKENRLYRIYNHMKMRCGHVKGADARHLRDYRDRGITVCDEWLYSFARFREWALSHGYRDDLTIDRIDNDKGYSPENCRWADYSLQNSNKRHCKRKATA